LLDQQTRDDLAVLRTLLAGRLASTETIEWALTLGREQRLKRMAILDLVNGPEGGKLAEPWRSAWRMIEEAWDNTPTAFAPETRPHEIGERVRAGERSGSLIAIVADHFAPRLSVSAASRSSKVPHKSSSRPKRVEQLVFGSLTGAKLVDPRMLGLPDVDDTLFLEALVHALEAALVRGLDIARRLGWNAQHRTYRLGQLYRVAFVPEAERLPDMHEPDEFHEGIAPCVKVLHYVAQRLAALKSPTALLAAARWQQTPTPIHLRLWAALARDPWIVSADSVGAILLGVDDDVFWDVQNYPEIAELRARRFAEFDIQMQAKLLRRLRRLPPRRHWPRDIDAEQLEKARRYWTARELRRLEIAGSVLPAADRAWLAAALAEFHALRTMDRLDEGFLSAPHASYVPPSPDWRFDSLAGQERLSALEAALGTARRGWDDDDGGRAWDWIRTTDNAAKLIPDFEASADAGAAYHRVWERFGWAHTATAEATEADKEGAVARVLALLLLLPESTLRSAIDGIANWLSSWRELVSRSSNGLAVWQRVWPIAVEATNAAQAAGEPIDLNLVASSNDREPMDLDTLNTPAGKLIDNFLAACPDVGEGKPPFAANVAARTLRDLVIAAGGRSGLIARHRLIEHLSYFLLADPVWAETKLLAPLRLDDSNALALWRALGRSTQFAKVIRTIGPEMLKRANDARLGRETRSSLVFSLVVECLHAFLENREPAISYSAVQQMLRSLDDELRSRGADAVTRFVRDVSSAEHAPTRSSDVVFRQAARPFLQTVWPQERSLATPGVSRAFADLPAAAGEAFVDAVDAIARFLVPFDAWSMLEYGLFGDNDGRAKLASIDTPAKAQAFLRLLDATIGTATSAVIPYDLAAALAQIETVAPALAQDQAFRRLATAARR
jgi:hypothetical protein